jgi:hypothetical protein
MSILNLLIVEDKSSEDYLRWIKAFNLGKEVQIESTVITKKEQAVNLLSDSNVYFDAAIVDLRLSDTEVDFGGRKIVEIIKDNLRFPIFVLTGNPEAIEDEKQNENDFFKVFVKGEENAVFDVLLDEIVKLYNTGITNILGKTGQIEKYLNDIFWNHLSNSINIWASDISRTPVQKEKALLRYTLSHIQEHLDLTENGESFEHYTPSEFYITPPIKPNLFTGDIVKFLGNKCIVLNPACDFGNRKIDNILLITIKEWESIDAEFDKRPISKGKENKLREHISNKVPRFHFIPKTNTIDAGFIDFQDKKTYDAKRVNFLIEKDKINRIATVSAPFLKDIISRYSNYYSRQGSPDFNVDEVYNSLL